MTTTTTRGIFSLEEILERQSDNTWRNVYDPFIYVSAVGSPVGTDYGYAGGGREDVGGQPWNGTSYVNRIDFNNDTATTSPRGVLSHPTAASAGHSNQSYGYVSGGNAAGSSPGGHSNVSRVNYSSDTSTASPKGNLNKNTDRATGVAYADYGYVCGGRINNNPGCSLIERLDYSNDGSTPVYRGNLNFDTQAAGSAGTPSYGWIMGKYAGDVRTQRIDYANDNVTTSQRGNLTAGRYFAGATGNATYGYIGGGSIPNLSSVDRVTYANDTVTATPRGPLTGGQRYAGVTGNQSYGYWMGGQQIQNPYLGTISSKILSNSFKGIFLVQVLPLPGLDCGHI